MTSKLSRRLFLGGAGAAILLPTFASLRPRTARAEDPPPARRFFAFYTPCGIHMPAWTPAKEGADYDLSPTLAPLAKVKPKISVITGLDNMPGKPEGPGDHAGGTSAFLTCRHVPKTDGGGVKNGTSIDQVIAKQVGGATRIASMQLGIDGGGDVGDCDSGYSCAYTVNVSWASDTQPLPKTTNPRVVFDQLFAGFDPKATAEQQARRKKYRTSILDVVRADAKSLKLKLGKTDNLKLDQYLASIDDLEKRIQKASSGPACTSPESPAASLPYPEHVKMMLDLSVVAFQCDITRVISFMLGNAGSNRNYGFLEGVSGSHHELSHHKNDPATFEMLKLIDRWEVAQLAHLLEQLDATPDPQGGSLLDHSLVYFSSEIEDGDSHRHQNMPIVVGGGLGGAFKTGRHVKLTGGPPVANLFVSFQQAFGVAGSAFGDNGSAPLAL